MIIQSDEEKFTGTWELGRSYIISGNDTTKEKIGYDVPYTYYTFKNNGTFEIITWSDTLINPDNAFNANNTWSVANNRITLNFADGQKFSWDYRIDKDTVHLTINDLEKNQRIERLFTKKKNIIDPNLVHTWDLIMKVIVSDTGEVDETPEITGKYETLIFQDNGTFTEEINDNGNKSNYSGSWSALINNFIILRYSSGNVSIKLYGVNSDEGTMEMDWSFIKDNMKFNVLAQYKRK